MAETRWSDAVSSGGEAPRWGGSRFGSRVVDRQQVAVQAEPARAFAPIQRIGGRQGWHFATWLLPAGLPRSSRDAVGTAGTRWS